MPQDESRLAYLRANAARFFVDACYDNTGVPMVTVLVRSGSGDPARDSREFAAFVYELAAELERRSGACRGRWTVSPQAYSGRIRLLVPWAEMRAGAEFLMKLVKDLGSSRAGVTDG